MSLLWSVILAPCSVESAQHPLQPSVVSGQQVSLEQPLPLSTLTEIRLPKRGGGCSGTGRPRALRQAAGPLVCAGGAGRAERVLNTTRIVIREGLGRETEQRLTPRSPGTGGRRERGESEGFQRWAGFLSRRQTREGGGQRASPIPAVPICGPDSCSHFGEGEGQGLIERAEKSQPAHGHGRIAVVSGAIWGLGTPAQPHLTGLSWGWVAPRKA